MNYMLFAGKNYYPSGGWEDFVEAFDTREEAIVAGDGCLRDDADWYNIADASVMKLVVRKWRE